MPIEEQLSGSTIQHYIVVETAQDITASSSNSKGLNRAQHVFESFIEINQTHLPLNVFRNGDHIS